MANIFWDPVSGSDSNNGTSFAQRVLTLNKAATLSSAGDTIRCKESGAPVSLAQNATFTQLSRTVTLTSALTTTITAFGSAWTASTGVTATTDSTNFWEGTKSSSLAIAAGFNFATTPIVAYFNTGTLN